MRVGRNDDHRGGLFLLAGNVRRYLAPFQPGVQCSLDVRNVRAFGARGESGRRSARACATRAANSVYEVLRDLRKIIIHHVRDPFHVYPAGCDIGRHQHPIVSLLEPAQRVIALVLAAVAVDCRALYASARELLRQPVGAELGTGEYQERTLLLAQHAFEQPQLSILFHFVKMQIYLLDRLRSRTDGNAHRVAYDAVDAPTVLVEYAPELRAIEANWPKIRFHALREHAGLVFQKQLDG